MSAAVRIVPIAKAHIDGYRAVLDEVARERRYLGMVQAPPLEDVREYVMRNITSRTPHNVALAGKEVVGWCDLMPKWQATLKHGAALGIGVARSWRGKGIGMQLLEATLRQAKEAGLTRIELTVRVDNESAKRLYEKFGFAVEGLCRRQVLIDGRYIDSYLMARLD